MVADLLEVSIAAYGIGKFIYASKSRSKSRFRT